MHVCHVLGISNMQLACSPAIEGLCCSAADGRSSAACELDASPCLLRSGLIELPDVATSSRDRAPILGLSDCWKVGVSGTASFAPAAARTRALKPLGLPGLSRDRAGSCTGASSETVPARSPEVLLKESSEAFAMSACYELNVVEVKEFSRGFYTLRCLQSTRMPELDRSTHRKAVYPAKLPIFQ